MEFHFREFEKYSDLVSRNAKEFPDKVCIYFKDKTYTYKELDTMVRRTANVFMAHGVGFGDRVTLLLGNSPEFLFAYFAASMMGAVIVPLNTFLKEREVSINMNDCGSCFLVTGEAFAGVISPLRALVPDMKQVFSFEDTSFDSVNIYKDSAATDAPINVSINPKEDLSTIIYTSGTTGKPKGVMLTHYNLVENGKGYNAGVEGTVDDITLLVLPMFHSFTFLACVSGPFIMGAGIAILGSVMEMSKESYAHFVKRVRPTMLLGVPQVYSTMARMKLTPEQRELFTFRICFSGGAPLPVETIRLFKENYGVPLVEGYGLSEAAPGVAVNPPRGVQKPGSIGLPLIRIEMKVVDENDNEVPINTPGELCVRGPNIMKGYWNQPEETACALRGGWLHTGDVAIKDEDGYYSIVDRLKDLILTKGMNVYPREIEELLYAYPNVLTAAVIGVPDKDGSEIVVAYVKHSPDAKMDETEIKHYLKDKLANFKVPRRIIFTDDIPINASGKVSKKDLRLRHRETV